MNGNCYEMILWWSDEDAAYVVEVPELPGCMAHGKTRPAAIRQAEAAIRHARSPFCLLPSAFERVLAPPSGQR
jgi:hypothetical protein